MAKDLLTDADNDLLIRDGDLVAGFSDDQHQLHLLLAAPGHYRASPLLGVHLLNWLDDDVDAAGLRAAIEKQLSLDGATIQRLRVGSNGSVDILSTYPDA